MRLGGSTHLVSAPALPEMSLGGGGAMGITGINMLGAADVVSVSSGGEAGEENDEGREEEEDHGCNKRPHGHGVFSLAAALVLVMIVDVVTNDAEQDEVSGHHHHGEDPCEGRGQRRKDCAANTGAESKDEGNECHGGDDGVEDHHARQGLSRVFRGGLEAGLVDGGHDFSWVIANVLAGTEVLLVGSGIAHAIAERTKGDRRSVGEGHLHDRDIIDDRRADGGNEEENGGSEEEECPHMVKGSSFGHFDE